GESAVLAGVKPLARSTAVAARSPWPPCSCSANAGSGAERVPVVAWEPPVPGAEREGAGLFTRALAVGVGWVCDVAGAPLTDTVLVPEPHAPSDRASATAPSAAAGALPLCFSLTLFIA